MTPIFEAKYIAMICDDRGTVLKIDEATLPTTIEIENASIYNIELQTYTRIAHGLVGQIAFHFLDINDEVEPYFIDASNNKIPLIKIPNYKWWVQKGKWSKKDKLWKTSLWNSVGEVKIIFGSVTCNINVRANTFTKKQLDLYLNDFRNDFWYLILKKDSITKGDAKNTKVKLLNNDSIELISKFIEYIEKVLGNPKKELREVQRLKDIKKVKPVARTFMEIATSGFQRKLTSRDTVESYNVPENRYIHYILQRTYNVVFYMLRASGHMEEIYENKYSFDQERLENFSDKKTIDKEAYENEIVDLKNRIEEEKRKLKSAILSQNDDLKVKLQNEINNQLSSTEKIQNALNLQQPINIQDVPGEFIIKLENRQPNYGNKLQFWGRIKRMEAENWDDFGLNNWLSLEFNKDTFDFLESGQEYAITAINSYSQAKTQKGVIHKIFFAYITELKLLNTKNEDSDNRFEYKTVTIKTYKNKEYNNVMQFNGEAQIPSGQWYKFTNNDFYSFEFNGNIFKGVLYDFQIYKITAYIESNKQSWSKNGKTGNIHKRHFRYITHIEQLSKSAIQKALEELESERESLEATNWQKPLSIQEKQEQENERKALEKSTNLLKEQQKYNLELVKSLEPKLHKLKILLSKCEAFKIKQDSYFPNSMTFVQNPNYQGTYSFYKKINDIIGVDEGLFIQLQLVEKIGLIDITAIYERWCFLQIIKVLIDKYRFLPEENWKSKLANQVVGDLNKIRDVKIKFSNTDIQREIDLWYEKELPNKKRPDFVLDIRSTFNKGYTHRLVMDAKFHEEVDVENQIGLLYNKKDYSEKNSNTVFILHPDSNKSIKKKRTPKKWGYDAYYGEIEMFNYEWDDKNPNHKYGAILLSPITKEGNYLDNLQRLIGMGMQYNLVDNSHILLGDLEKRKDMLDPRPEEKVFCLVCGNNKFHESRMPTKYGHGYRYSFTCDECKHFCTYNYCWQCHHRLVKNGEYWSYHSAQILEPFNIKCPNCSELIRG